jgi:hypothetical protein
MRERRRPWGCTGRRLQEEAAVRRRVKESGAERVADVASRKPSSAAEGAVAGGI